MLRNEKTIIIRWVARIVAGLLATLVLVIFVGHCLSSKGPGDLFEQPLSVLIEFAALFIGWLGLIIAWKFEGPGAGLILIGTIIFHLVEGKVWINWVFGLFGLVGILFLICSLTDSSAKNPA